MAFRELSTIMNWPEPYFPTGKFVLVRDTLEAEGGVLLPHFLFGYLKADQRALLVGFEQSFFHYFSVGRKLACNLKMAQTKGQFMHINALSTPYEWSAPDSSTSSSSSTSPSSAAATAGTDNWSLGSDEEGSLRALYQKVKTFVEAGQGSSEVCIIIDNLSVLLDTCERPSLVLDLIHYLHLLTQRVENRASLVVLVHGDVEDDRNLTNALEHRADIIMAASGLATGYSKEVNGQVIVSERGAAQGKLMHFKALDNNVRFMSK